MRADWPPWLGKRSFRTSAACCDSTPGTRSLLSNLPPALPCSADDGDGGHEPEAQHPERVPGAAATEAVQECAHGILLECGPAACGTTATIQERADLAPRWR